MKLFYEIFGDVDKYQTLNKIINKDLEGVEKVNKEILYIEGTETHFVVYFFYNDVQYSFQLVESIANGKVKYFAHTFMEVD